MRLDKHPVPELPDVEGFRRLLHSRVVGDKVTAIEVRDPGVVRGRSGEDFGAARGPTVQ